jgi:hypothetical protein
MPEAKNTKKEKVEIVSTRRVKYESFIRNKLWDLRQCPGKYFQDRTSIESLSFFEENSKVKITSDDNGTHKEALGTRELKLDPEIRGRSQKAKEDFFYLVNKDIENKVITNYGEGDQVVVVKPLDFLNWFQDNGYPVPNGLIEAIKEGNIGKGAKLLKLLRTCFIDTVLKGKKLNLDISREEKPKESTTKPDKKKKKETPRQKFKKEFLEAYFEQRRISSVAATITRVWYKDLLKKYKIKKIGESTLSGWIKKEKKNRNSD